MDDKAEISFNAVTRPASNFLLLIRRKLLNAFRVVLVAVMEDGSVRIGYCWLSAARTFVVCDDNEKGK